MARVFRYRNYGVYIGYAKAEQHHMPHAHIKMRKTPVCTINLMTLEPMQRNKKVPAGLLPELESHRERMLETWERLNP
jgi:hypothetical protein